MSALVVYASTHGHTARIAARIAEAMRAHGVEADLHDVASAGDAEPGLYDVVVVGASLHKEHHQQQIVDWVTARRDELEHRPSVFFSVSLSAAEDTDEAHAATQRCIDEFCAQTGWTPARTERIAPDDAPNGTPDRRATRLRLHRLGRGRPLRARGRGARPRRRDGVDQFSVSSA